MASENGIDREKLIVEAEKYLNANGDGDDGNGNGKGIEAPTKN